MGKHKRIRGLSDTIVAVSDQIAADLDDNSAEAQARLQALRDAMSGDDFIVLCLAAKGNGPRKIQEICGGSTATWTLRIREVLGLAWRVLDPAGFERDRAQMYDWEVFP
jgi:hypothetical protein